VGQFLIGLLFFVLGAAYLLAPLFSREATWQTGGTCSPTLIAVGATAAGIVQMVEVLAGDAGTLNHWLVIIGAIILVLIGEGWRRRIVRPQDIMRRGGGGSSLDNVARARFEEKRRKEKEEAERIVRDEEGSREVTQTPSPLERGPLWEDSRAQPHKGDIYQKIRKLAELRDEGLLTPEEFEAKKRDLLDRL
jgi:hypothetical protein